MHYIAKIIASTPTAILVTLGGIGLPDVPKNFVKILVICVP